MEEAPWKQVNITYPGPDRHQRERQAIDHLARVLPAAEAAGQVTAWFFVRKGPWRVRYQLADHGHGGGDQKSDPLHPLLTEGVHWTRDIYEPEMHAFGGPGSMDAAHTLFHHDSTHLLTFFSHNAQDRREHSLLLCTALMRTAGLDPNEQGDVWARVTEQRPGLANIPPDPQVRASFTSDVRCLLLGEARTDLIGQDWLIAFEEAGRTLRSLRQTGTLTRGLRAIITLHVIFHWNRIGLTASTQATLAHAAKEAMLDNSPE